MSVNEVQMCFSINFLVTDNKYISEKFNYLINTMVCRFSLYNFAVLFLNITHQIKNSNLL